jgi:hypothetical protein
MKQTETNQYLNYLSDVVMGDVATLRHKERSYSDSWKRRGGVGAFMMAARKWDRIENLLSRPGPGQWDIFEGVRRQPGGEDGTVLAEIRDLRCYLTLVESEMVAQRVVQPPTQIGTPEDGGHHEKDNANG